MQANEGETPTRYPTLTLRVPSDAAEAVSEQLEAGGALAVTLCDAGVGADERPVYEPGVGETPLWPSTRVEALFADQATAAAAWRELDPESREAAMTGSLADRDWTRAWLDRFAPQRFGKRVWICPREAQPPSEATAPGAALVRLDPGLAFGTGNHATTALCLAWLDALDWSKRDRHLIDYGCGSGILAIAALRLGARAAVAVDHDPQAVTATVANAADNGVESALRAGLPSLTDGERCDVLVANILARPLIELAPTFGRLAIPGARLAVSGILRDQKNAVADALAPWFEWREEYERDGWVLLAGTRGA